MTAARELYTHFSGLQFFGYGAFTSLLYIAGVDAMPESTIIFTVILLAVWSPAFRNVFKQCRHQDRNEVFLIQMMETEA